MMEGKEEAQLRGRRSWIRNGKLGGEQRREERVRGLFGGAYWRIKNEMLVWKARWNTNPGESHQKNSRKASQLLQVSPHLPPVFSH
jgi:hypothetical protein